MTLDDVLNAIDAESEYDGPATAEFLAEQEREARGDTGRLFIEALRAAARDTKAGIRERIIRLASKDVTIDP